MLEVKITSVRAKVKVFTLGTVHLEKTSPHAHGSQAALGAHALVGAATNIAPPLVRCLLRGPLGTPLTKGVKTPPPRLPDSAACGRPVTHHSTCERGMVAAGIRLQGQAGDLCYACEGRVFRPTHVYTRHVHVCW